MRRFICRAFNMARISTSGAAAADPTSQQANAAVISSPEGRVNVRVIKTNEDLMIARHVLAVLVGTGPEAS